MGGVTGLRQHVSLLTELWHRWQLLGDSVTVQWVPSHVGVQGMNGQMQVQQKGETSLSRSVTRQGG